MDAKWLSERLKDAPEAKKQIAFADVILLNKTDLVDEAALARRRGAASARSTRTPRIHRTRECEIPIAEVLDRKAFDLDRIMEVEPDFLEHGHHHHHDDEIDLLLRSGRGEVDPDKFMPWISEPHAAGGAEHPALQGHRGLPGRAQALRLPGRPHDAGRRPERDWKPDEKRESRMVFIGRDLKQKAIRDSFMACGPGRDALRGLTRTPARRVGSG